MSFLTIRERHPLECSLTTNDSGTVALDLPKTRLVANVGRGLLMVQQHSRSKNWKLWNNPVDVES